jgi:hypothetical protein
VRHKTGIARRQIFFERAADITHFARLNERTRKMGAADHRLVFCERKGGIKNARNPSAGEVFTHFPCALQAPVTHAGQTIGERRVIGVHTEADDMQRGRF